MTDPGLVRTKPCTRIKNVTIKIYTKEKEQYKKLVAMMKAAGASDTIKFKRTTKK